MLLVLLVEVFELPLVFVRGGFESPLILLEVGFELLKTLRL